MKTSVVVGKPVAPNSFQEKERQCRALFDSVIRRGLSFWHVCTPGTFQQIIFESPADYEFGMVTAATASYDTGVKIITFELMSNHVHFVVYCKAKENAVSFLELYRKRLIRYFRNQKRVIDLSHFYSEPIAIETLESLRNQIVYTNRNNFVVDPSQTPFSFPYGANAFFFNPFAKAIQGCSFGTLSLRSKIRLIHSKETDYPDAFMVTGSHFTPPSFCDISLGEKIFRDARHYMYKLTRDVESYKELAALLSDVDYYTDDELVTIVYSICREKYGSSKPSLLPVQQKEELAGILHYEYRADNRKISRLLQFPIQTLNEKFP